MKKQQFTREEVQHLLLALLMFSNANNNQGLDAMCPEPETFGGKAFHLLSVADEINLEEPKSVLSTLAKIKMN